MALSIDGQSKTGPSPVQALALALAGCMAVDVVDIVVKGRHPAARASPPTSPPSARPSRRAGSRPWRCTSSLEGDVPAHAVERAIALSHDKYCSVWHSLRQDIAFETSFEVAP